MTDEEYRAENQRKAQLRAERQAIVRQQRQEENDLEFLSYEDPSLYKAVMDKQAAENAALTASNPVTGFGTLTDGSEVYQSGQSRRDIVDYLAPERGLKRDTIQKFMGGNASRSGGFGVADLLGAGLLDAADGLSFSRDMNKRNDLAIAQLEEQIIAEGVKPYSLEFYRQRNARMPEMETSFDAMLDIGIGGIEAVTLGTSRLITKPVKGFLKNLSAKFASPVTPSPSAGALPTANTVAQQTAREILELRAAGRSNEVTEQMMSAADDPYMFENTPLDMSQEALMARAKAEGRVPALHGTGSDISAVDSAYFGSGKEDLLGSGFYTTTNPKRADRYLPIGNPPLERGVFQSGNKEYTEGANVMPLMVKELKPFNLEEPLGDVADQIAEAYSKDPFFKVETMSSGVHIISNENGSAMLDPYLPKADALFKLRKAFGPEDVSMVLSDIGYSGVSGPEALGNRVRVNYNPEDVRSRFARFDPEFRNLANLSAGFAAIGFSGLAAGLKENQDGGI